MIVALSWIALDVKKIPKQGYSKQYGLSMYNESYISPKYFLDISEASIRNFMQRTKTSSTSPKASSNVSLESNKYLGNCRRLRLLFSKIALDSAQKKSWTWWPLHKMQMQLYLGIIVGVFNLSKTSPKCSQRDETIVV